MPLFLIYISLLIQEGNRRPGRR